MKKEYLYTMIPQSQKNNYSLNYFYAKLHRNDSTNNELKLDRCKVYSKVHTNTNYVTNVYYKNISSIFEKEIDLDE